MKEKTAARRTGDMGEDAAEKLLIRKGYQIIARNYRTAGGEIDIIAGDKEFIVFAEVKTRNSLSVGRPSAWVDDSKQKKIINTAFQFLQENDCALQPRFDVIEIVLEKGTDHIVYIRHIENAFSQSGDYAVF